MFSYLFIQMFYFAPIEFFGPEGLTYQWVELCGLILFSGLLGLLIWDRKSLTKRIKNRFNYQFLPLKITGEEQKQVPEC